jgi:DNA-binding MarR family transcriptional regulator
VGSHELAPELQERLRAALGSYEELQLLLHARRHPGPWSVADAARALHLEEPTLAEALERLVQAGFLVVLGDGPLESRRFTYRPHSLALDELTERLAEAVDHDPLHVLETMNRHALERLRTSAIRTFASAFVLGKKKDG